MNIITHQPILAKFLYYMSPKRISGIYLESAILTVSTKTLCFRSKTTSYLPWQLVNLSVCYVSVVSISRVQMIHSDVFPVCLSFIFPLHIEPHISQTEQFPAVLYNIQIRKHKNQQNTWYTTAPITLYVISPEMLYISC